MIDIHAHVLPGVDDGAATMEQAVELLEQAARSGTRDLILTPHCAPAYGFFNFDDQYMEERFLRLCQVLFQLEVPLNLHRGMEVLYQGEEDFRIHADRYFPLCGSRYLLVEFPFDTGAEELLEGISVISSCGYVPILAHPERYLGVQGREKTVLEGRRMGALCQINKGSLAGRHGQKARETALTLLNLNGADFVASDAHHPRYRTARLDRVYQFVAEEYGAERAKRLFEENPRRVMEDEPLHESCCEVSQ